MAGQKFPPFPIRSLIIPVIGLPVVACIAFLQNHPLGASITAQIQSSPTVSESFESSPLIRHLTNARQHEAYGTTCAIRIPRSHLQGLSDEQLLTRLVKGFYGGVIFQPEKICLGLLARLGVQRHHAQFSDSPASGTDLTEISEQGLPPPCTSLFHGTFMVLDSRIRSTSMDAGKSSSYVDIGFGNDATSFVGMHRFEVSPDPSPKGDYSILTLSSLACNPKSDKPSYLGWFVGLHTWYAGQLFRDGIREVLIPVGK